MRRQVITIVLIMAVVFGLRNQSFASDWDKAGKVLAVFEGLRILTGGRADVIGTITGINQPRYQHSYSDYCRYDTPKRHYRPSFWSRRCCEERIWVPHYVIKERFIPEHIEYRDGKRVEVEAHYEKIEVEQGGHWEVVCRPCH
ncbi:MAG: hypothetical protein N2606_02325 [Candidatus Omnitrophica bacterium]|nr:hypothetical protein [Candidatus Omnitrophota bacterium]